MARLTRLIVVVGMLALALVLAAPVAAGSRPAPDHAPATADAPCGNLNPISKTWDVDAGRPAILDVLADDCPGQATATRPVTITAVTTATPFSTGTYARVSTDGRSVFYNPIGCTLGDGGDDYFAYTITDGVTTKTGYEVVHLKAPTAGSNPFADTPDGGFISNSTVGSTVPVKIAWCGLAASGASLKSYRLYQSADGGVTYPAATTYTTTSVIRSLRPTTLYRWQLTATDKAAKTSALGEASAISRVLAYADTSSKIKYSSGWTSAVSSRYLNSREKQVTRSGATATLTVSNIRQVAIVGTKGVGRGSFYVYIDGRRVKTVSERAGSSVYRRVLYVAAIPGDTAGTHTIMIKTASRSRVGLDGIFTLSGRGTPDLAFTAAAPGAATVSGPADPVGATTTAPLPSGLTLTAGSWPACALDAGNVSYHGRGTCTVTATVPADTAWNARAITEAYTVSGLLQAITFDPLADATYGDPDRTLSATADSGLTVAFGSQTPTVCAVNGTTVSILTAGTCTVRASQAGDTTREPAANVDRSFDVAKVDLTVTGVTAADKTYDGTATATLDTTNAALVGVLPGDAVTLVTTGATGTFSSAGAGTGKVVTVAGLALAGADAGNYALTQPTDTADIAKATQAINVTSTPPTPIKDGPTYPTAATATSGLAVAVTVAANPVGTCSVASGVVSFTNAGQCTVQFDQAGDANWLAAPREVQVLTVASTGSTPQTITFDPLAGVTYGVSPISLTATSDSGLTVTLASLDPDICTVSGTTATVIAAGTCDIQASQAGDPTYLPATPVTRSLVVAKRAITVTAAATSKTYDGNTSSATLPTISGAGLASGDTAHFIQVYSTATVGSNKTLTPSGTVSKGAVDVTTSYTITFTPANVGTINPGPATTLELTGLTGGTAGTPQTFVVTARDFAGNVATGYRGTVVFTSTDPTATLPSNYTFTALDNGAHTFTNGVTLKTAGTRQVTATDQSNGTITGNQSGLVITPATAASLQVTAASPQTAGTSFSVTVVAKDAYGNTATGYTGTVTLTTNDSAGTMPAAHAYTAPDAGSFVFTGATLRTAGSHTITANGTSPSITGTSGSITVNPEVAAHFVVAAGTSQTAGTAFTVTVTAQDAYNNTATGYRGTAHFTSSDLQAVLPANYTFLAGDNGVHVFTNGATLKTAGTQSITATDTLDALVTGSQAGITVAAAASATQLEVAGFTSPATAGVADTFTVTARDQYGNVVTGYAGTVSFTSNDANAVLPASSTLVNGTKTFSATLRTAGANRSITAGDGSISGAQTGITVNPAGAATFTVAGITSPTTAGTPRDVTVTAHDAFNNVATGYTGTVHFTSTDGTANLPANYAFTGGDAGVHTFTGGVILKATGTQSVTATDTVTGSITGTQSGITVNPGTAVSFALTGYPSPTVAGASHTVTVTAHDAFSNTATGYAGTVHLTSSDGAAVLGADAGLTSGVGTFAVTLKTAGSRTITATDTVSSSITGTSAGITVNPDTTAGFTVTGYPSPTVAGVQHSVTVTAKDLYGNTVTGFAGTVAITSSDGAANLPSNGGLTSGVGTFNVTLKTAGSRSIIATQVGSPAITGSQAGITVDPAAASVLTVTGYPSTTTAGDPHSLTVTAKDAFGNTDPSYTGTVHFTSTDGAAVLPPDYAFQPGDAGVKTFTGVILKTVGTRSITATDTVTGTITGVQSGITVQPGAAASLALTVNATQTAGTPFTVTVTAHDGSGNVATGYTGTVTFSTTDGGAVALPSPYTFVGGDAGVKVFTGGFTLVTAGSQTITAGDGSLSITSGPITVLAGAAAHLTVGGVTDPTTAGTPESLTVTAVDAHGNPTTLGGTIHLTSSDAQATLPADFPLVAGTATVSVTLKTAGEQTITATSSTSGSINGTQSAITVQHAALQNIAIMTAAAGGTIVNGLSVPSGTTATVYANSRDAFGNIIANVSVDWTLTSKTGGVVDGDLAPATGTSATFTGGLVGTAVISADDGSGHTDNTGTVTVTPGVAASLSIEDAAAGGATIPDTAVSTPVVMYAITRDAAGNVVANVAATWSLTAITGGVVAGDLVPAPDTKSATFTANGTGTAIVHAEFGAFAADTGTLTTP